MTWSDGTTSSRRGTFTVSNKGATTPSTSPTPTVTPTKTPTDPPTTSAPRAKPNRDNGSADDRGANIAHDDFGSAHHNRARTYAVNNSAAGPEWIVAERSSRKDLRQHVSVERTRNRPCWRHHCSRR